MSEAAERPVAEAVNLGVPQPQVDFGRSLVAILGLPFDAIGLDEAVRRIRAHAFAGQRCFVSTPNLNFAISASVDAAFRGSVLRSDLSLVDGMPLVWIAKLLRLPVRERVSGADVFDELQAHAGPPISVFLFGGPPGAAAQACEAINRRGGGVRCVGVDEAGFGSIESMSNDDLIARINHSGAHFVVASLGAKKGQAWLEHNAARLTAPVLSHLGAVVNFAAGSVQRAPRWMRWSGLEWLWRIKEEPALWRRYRDDGLAVARLMIFCVLPDAIALRRTQARGVLPPPRIEEHESPNATTLRLQGAWCGDAQPLRDALTRCAARARPVTLDLSGVTEIDSTFIALLLVAHGWFASRGGLAVVAASPAVTAMFRHKLAGHLLASPPESKRAS